MALITRPPAWSRQTSTMTGTPSTNFGVTVTPGTSNANGSSVTLLSALGHDAELIVFGFSGFNTAAANNDTHVDILIDPAGGTSWLSTPLIADLCVGGALTQGIAAPPPKWVFFPVWVPAGAALGARARTAHTVAPTTPRVHAFALGGNSNPASWWCGQTVTAIGTTAASCSGTSHTPGNSGAFSAWTNFGSTIPSAAGAIQFLFQSSNNAQNSSNYFLSFGVGSTQIWPTICVLTSTAEANWMTPTGPLFCSLQSGTQLQVRATCGGTAQALEVAAYVVS